MTSVSWLRLEAALSLDPTHEHDRTWVSLQPIHYIRLGTRANDLMRNEHVMSHYH